jgi:hypothetical protein
MISHFILNFGKTGAQYPQGYFTNNCMKIHSPFQVMVGQGVLHVQSSWVPKLTQHCYYQSWAGTCFGALEASVAIPVGKNQV